jgi:hypothetical protein
MQVSFQSALTEHPEFSFMYNKIDKANQDIDGNGISHLSKANWESLELLILSKAVFMKKRTFLGSTASKDS